MTKTGTNIKIWPHQILILCPSLRNSGQLPAPIVNSRGDSILNRRTSNFEGLVTLTLTLNRVILHTVVHHSLTSTYTPNFTENDETFCGWTYIRTHGRTNGRMDGHLRPTLLGRLRRVYVLAHRMAEAKCYNWQAHNKHTGVRKSLTKSCFKTGSSLSQFFEHMKATIAVTRQERQLIPYFL